MYEKYTNNINLKLCFIHSIMPRSGTNYLYDLLNLHPMCYGEGPIWEDHFVQHSKLLKDYTNRVFSSWNPEWKVEENVANQKVFLSYLGEAIKNFLSLQLSKSNIDQINFEQIGNNSEKAQILLSKTPNLLGLENFFDLFPSAYLIIIIRDGRSVVESGVKSFDWIYEDAMRRWRIRARDISNLQKVNNLNKKFLIVKYEDLFKNVETELEKVFNFLELPSDSYDFNSATKLGVKGSSESRKQAGNVHWNVVKKEMNFNPLDRFSNWKPGRHRRFNWIAGNEMINLGYNLMSNNFDKGWFLIWNMILDIRWKIRSLLVKIKRKIISN